MVAYLSIKKEHTSVCVFVPLIDRVDLYLERLLLLDAYVVAHVFLHGNGPRGPEPAASVLLAAPCTIQDVDLHRGHQELLLTWK